MSDFIERQYNLTKRDDVAQSQRKRRKLEDSISDDEKKKMASTTFSGITNGGDISQHLKEERQMLAEGNGPPTTAPIDLTNDDDEEVQIVSTAVKQTGENEEICLGLLTEKANISRIPKYKNPGASTEKHFPRTQLRYRRGKMYVVELLDGTGRVVGTMAAKLARALSQLIDGAYLTKLRLTIYLQDLPRKKGLQPGDAVSENINVMVLIYAMRGKKDIIGKYLSTHQLFLGSPRAGGFNAGKEFDNPQVPRAFGGVRRPQTSQPASAMPRSIEEQKRETNSIFDDLTNHEDLEEMEPNTEYIKTPLLAHQKQALKFLTDHEKTSADDQSKSSVVSLWRPRVDERGKETWYNVITDHVSAVKPDGVQGGILADMMGLGKTLSILSLIAHTRDEAKEFCDERPPPDVARARRNSRATLIICPKSVMANWDEQLKAHTRSRTSKIYTYHGSNRLQDIDRLADHDIVLTTYNTAAAELGDDTRALAAINWFRIVLDEAHSIRNPSAQVSKACCALDAQRRWAVTGTPVQNTLEDLGTLIKFLRIKPFEETKNFNQYILAPFKTTNEDVVSHLRLLVDSITLRRQKDKIDLKERHQHRIVLEFAFDERKIYEKISGESNKQYYMMTGNGKQSRFRGKAYAHVLKSIGRMRQFCAHGLDMFSEEDRRQIEEGMNPDNAIAVDLGDDEDTDGYKFITDITAHDWLNVVIESDENTCMNCSNKIGETKPSSTKGATHQGKYESESNTDTESDTSADDEQQGGPGDIIGALTPCYHLLCTDCIGKYKADVSGIQTRDQYHTCPYCSTYVRTGLYEYRQTLFKDYLEAKAASAERRKKGRKYDQSFYTGPSTKVKQLIADLQASQLQSEQLSFDEPPIRSVVFSGWTTYLDLIELALDDNKIGYVRLDGSMSVKQRAAVLVQFANDPTITVLLVSIKAGGQGLNLTAANNVYMMEPQFNPGVEQQAIDRVHRLGQKREVFIKHYIMKDSIEGGVLKLQERKEKLARLALEKKMNKAEVAKARAEMTSELMTGKLG